MNKIVIKTLLSILLFEISFLNAVYSQKKIKMDIAKSKIALIIGNETYSNGKRYKSSNKDAELITKTLKKQNYNVTLLQNSSYLTLNEQLNKTFKILKDNEPDIFLLYITGDGLQVNNVNYLIPIDKTVKDYSDIDSLISIRNIFIELMKIRNKLNFIVLDIPRINPLPETNYNNLFIENIFPDETFVINAYFPGEKVLDIFNNNKEYSNFAVQFSKLLKVKNISLSEFDKLLRNSIIEKTNGFNSTCSQSSLSKEYYLNKK